MIERFHIQKLAGDAVQQMRIERRWSALQQANDGERESEVGKDSVSATDF